jgi:hypothetical protein
MILYGMSYTQPLAAWSETPLAAVHNSYSFLINEYRVDSIQDDTTLSTYVQLRDPGHN